MTPEQEHAYKQVRAFMAQRGYRLEDERYHETVGLLYDFATEALRAARQTWIPVSERLPEHDTEVLVYVPTAKHNKVDMDVWEEIYEAPVSFSSKTIYVGDGWGNHEFEDITHWQPLPQPPQGE